MSFIHPLLLGGLLLVGIPVLIHLIMQQKPKHLLFPAVRFLLQKQRTNQRRLRLRHLLLLALRMGLIALVCLALARPILGLSSPWLLGLFGERLNLAGDRPLTAVLVFDTSLSMEYKAGPRTLLEEAKRRALELLAEFPASSRVAVLDTARPGAESFEPVAEARKRIAALEPSPANAPVTRQLNAAFRLLGEAAREQAEGGEPPPRFLYVFSDRTPESWDPSDVRGLKPPPGVSAFYLDFGEDKPEDVAVTELRLSRTVVPAGGKVEVEVRVRSASTAATPIDTLVTCYVDRKPERPWPVKLPPGGSASFSLELNAARKADPGERAPGMLSQGLHQIEVSLGTSDDLPFNNARYATFEVRAGRPVLLVADDPLDARPWKFALEETGEFRCDVKDPADLDDLTPAKLYEDYKAVCLVNVARPSSELWQKLKAYVAKGRGLAVIPPAEENAAAYQTGAALEVLPAKLVRHVTRDEAKPALWTKLGRGHALTEQFVELSKDEALDFEMPQRRPRAWRYWEAEPNADDPAKRARAPVVVVGYADDKERPALVEGFVGDGRVLLFTTALDGRHLEPRWRWNDYWQGSSFGLVLANLAVGHLAGDAERAEFNYLCVPALEVPVQLPARPAYQVYSLQGPGLNDAADNVKRPENQNQVKITQAVQPGNFLLRDRDGNRVAGFSLNVPERESDLSRIPAEQIEALFGPGSVRAAKGDADLHDTLQGGGGRPVEVELFSWLMILLLLALALENLLANKFYRRPAQEQPQAAFGHR